MEVEEADSYSPLYRLDDRLVDSPWCRSFVSDLDSLCVAKDSDTHCPVFYRTVRCINLDQYEKAQAKCCHTNCKPTVDAVVGIQSVVDSLKQTEALLIELRLNYQSTRNLDAKNINDKIEHSGSIIRSNCGSPTHPFVFLIFKDEVASQARSWLHRHNLSGRHPYLSGAKPTGRKGLLEYIGIPDPFVPTFDSETIRRELLQAFKTNGINGLNGAYHNWKTKALPFRNRYELKECESIYRSLVDVLNTIYYTASENERGAVYGMVCATNKELTSILPPDIPSAIQREGII